MVVLAQERADGIGGLLGVVVRDLWKQVVDDVQVDDVVHEVPEHEARVAVDGAEGAAEVGPGALGELGQVRMRMVEIGDDDCATPLMSGAAAALLRSRIDRKSVV